MLTQRLTLVVLLLTATAAHAQVMGAGGARTEAPAKVTQRAAPAAAPTAAPRASAPRAARRVATAKPAARSAPRLTTPRARPAVKGR
jgi:hypothetical protein